jgi:hypothetical protein
LRNYEFGRAMEIDVMIKGAGAVRAGRRPVHADTRSDGAACPLKTRDKGIVAVSQPPHAPIPEFASYRSNRFCELRNQRSTSKSISLVRH